MQSDEKTIRLTKLWYYTKEVVTLLEISKTVFERDIKPHRNALGKKLGKKWTNVQVKKIFYLLTPHVHIIID